jgi:hypothetical protein
LSTFASHPPIPPEIAAPISVPPGIAARAISSEVAPAAHKQLHPLVEQIFFSGAHKNVRHVVVFGIDSDHRIGAICDGIADILVSRTQLDIGIVEASSSQNTSRSANDEPTLQGVANEVAKGLWRVKVDLGGHCWSLQDHESRGPSNIRRLHSDFDCTITHTPPISSSFLGAVMGCFSDGVILVVRAGKTRRAAAQSSLQLLRRNKVRVLGAILDDRRFPIPHSLYERL